jgi:prepilin-type N-terminal cleavage/methylation domain-containing protein/prepilin-type processing-associated H-X9-DG protein
MRRHSGKTSQKSGFTLIELLVVIAIIAILAAILFPVFAKVREKARQTSCLSNEKQLGLSFTQYVEDYDEKYPVNGGGNNEAAGWGSRVYPYTKSTGVYHCPDDPTTTTTNLDGKGETDYPVSYAFNKTIADNNGLAAQNAPASTVLLFEVEGVQADITNVNNELNGGNYVSAAGNGGDGGNFTGNFGWLNSNNGNYYYASGVDATWGFGNPSRGTGCQKVPYHTGGSNVLFADGHAKWVRAAAISPGTNANASTDGQDQSSLGEAAGTSGLSAKNFAGTFSVN